MSHSEGGAYLPSADYTRTGATDTGGTYKTATLSSPTLNSATIPQPTMAVAVQSVTAAGTNQATGGVIAAQYPSVVVVTAANTTKGVVLPTSAAGMLLFVQNSVTNESLPVYPASGEVINALSSNTAYTLAGAKTAVFACQVAGTWFTILTA